LRRRRREELDLSGFRIEPADAVGVLHRKPQDAALVEDERVRILRFRVRHLVLGDLAGLRIELTDERSGVARVPDVAGLVFDQAVRSRVRGLQRIFLYRAGLRVYAAELVSHLPAVPERAIARGE